MVPGISVRPERLVRINLQFYPAMVNYGIPRNPEPAGAAYGPHSPVWAEI